jgi:hypothetical protein
VLQKTQAKVWVFYLYLLKKLMKYCFLFTLIFVFINLNAQNDFDLKVKYGVDDKVVQEIIRFEDLFVYQVEMKGKKLIDKNYTIILKEFRNNKLINSTLLLDSSINDLFKIKIKQFNFRALGKKNDKGELKIKFAFDRFSTQTETLNLDRENLDFYIIKELTINKKDLLLGKSFYFLSILTPTPHSDGSSSYCEVVSGDNPEKMSEKFNIPHYFLFEMTVKD